MSHPRHRREAPLHVPTVVLTVSDTRTPETDTGGALIRRLLSRAGHPVVESRILPDEPVRVRRALRSCGRDRRVKAVILTGGTGISTRDRTYEAVDGLLEKRLEGFGEIFRILSYRQVGPAAFLSRTTAGVYRGRILFSLPGSVKAVALAMEKLILPELGHLAFEISKDPPRSRSASRRRS